MSKFSITFVIDSKHLGTMMEVLQPYRVEDLSFKVVAGTAKKIRAGDRFGWEIAGTLADNTPRPMVWFKDKLLEAGFKSNGSIYNSVNTAVERGLLTKKMVKGKPMYVKGRGT